MFVALIIEFLLGATFGIGATLLAVAVVYVRQEQKQVEELRRAGYKI